MKCAASSSKAFIASRTWETKSRQPSNSHSNASTQQIGQTECQASLFSLLKNKEVILTLYNSLIRPLVERVSPLHQYFLNWGQNYRLCQFSFPSFTQTCQCLIQLEGNFIYVCKVGVNGRAHSQGGGAVKSLTQAIASLLPLPPKLTSLLASCTFLLLERRLANFFLLTPLSSCP